MLSVEPPSDYVSKQNQYQIESTAQQMDYYGQYQTWGEENRSALTEQRSPLSDGINPQFPPVTVDLPQIGSIENSGGSSAGSGTGNDSMEAVRLQSLPPIGNSVPVSPLINTGAVTKLRKTKKKKKRDPHEPQKPVSAYALFFRDTQSSIKVKKPDASFGEISKLVASMWDNLEQDAKTEYKRRTETAKKEYLRKLAAYKARMVSREIPLGYGAATSYMGLSNLNYYSHGHQSYPSSQNMQQNPVPHNYYHSVGSQQHMQSNIVPMQYPQHQMSPGHHGMMIHANYGVEEPPQHHYAQNPSMGMVYHHSIADPRPYPGTMNQLHVMDSGSPCTYNQTTSPGSCTGARDSSSPKQQTPVGTPQMQYHQVSNDNLLLGHQWPKKDEQYSALAEETNSNSVRDIYYWMSRSDRDLSEGVL